jgi:hypothetical protein
MAWAYGDTVVERQYTGDRCWLELPCRVVSDEPELLVTYLPRGAPFTYLPGPWPTANGHHPWYPGRAWTGHGVLMLHRPGDAYGVWHFWTGPERVFDCWYLNVQEWGRHDGGFWIRDLELDVIVEPDGAVAYKDAELVDVRVAEGRMTTDDAALARRTADDVAELVRAGEAWWDPAWTRWSPPPGWDAA